MAKYFFIAILLVILGAGFYLYKQSTYTHINVKFQELRPFHQKLPVYYKGIIIGKAKERKHSDDFTHTIVKVVLSPKKLMLPENSTVLLKKERRNNEKEHDFLEIIYPNEPSDKMISDGTTLEGKATTDIDTFMANQKVEDLENIRTNLAESAENLNAALAGLSELFATLDSMAQENRVNFKTASKNLAATTQNFQQVSAKFDKSLQQKSLDNTILNLEKSTQNLQTVTGNLTTTTDSVNIAMPRVDSTLYETHSLISNANAISCGVRQTLRKRFGGLRLIFGRTINECEKPKCCPKQAQSNCRR